MRRCRKAKRRDAGSVTGMTKVRGGTLNRERRAASWFALGVRFQEPYTEREPASSAALPAMLPLEFHAEVDALCPEVGGAEQHRGSVGGAEGRRQLGAVHDAVDLIAGTDHIAPVDAVVADESPTVVVELVD